MRVVYKYVFEESTLCVNLPEGSQVLTVASQDDQVTMWIEQEVGAGAELGVRRFRLVMTGEEFAPEGYENWTYVGTVFVGVIVAHVYEITRN